VLTTNKDKKNGRKKRLVPEQPEMETVSPESDPQAEAETKEDVLVPGDPEVMTVQEIMVGEDCSESTAVKIHAGMVALARERSFREFAKRRKDGAHYLCIAKRPTGYWRIGRHFKATETIIFRDELTPKQITELESTDPVHMKVECIGFTDAKPEKLEPADPGKSEDDTQPIG
jgi:hypothetical protein